MSGQRPKPPVRNRHNHGLHLALFITEELTSKNLITTCEFPKLRGTLIWGPYNTDPTI